MRQLERPSSTDPAYIQCTGAGEQLWVRRVQQWRCQLRLCQRLRTVRSHKSSFNRLRISLANEAINSRHQRRRDPGQVTRDLEFAAGGGTGDQELPTLAQAHKHRVPGVLPLECVAAQKSRFGIRHDGACATDDTNAGGVPASVVNLAKRCSGAASACGALSLGQCGPRIRRSQARGARRYPSAPQARAGRPAVIRCAPGSRAAPTATPPGRCRAAPAARWSSANLRR